MPMIEPQKVVVGTYTNHRGETRERRIVPLHIYWGVTPHHPTNQWLLYAYDVEKEAWRDFALSGFTDGLKPE